ncbi:MAG: hypothetical protein HKN72_14015 [Gemmatimonadetes bacterium]|nr:hypothetical protein [Gemmatimonadota bacterium]NNF14343.1 hypothetical protein [Gemmatimonadota bacterium]
MTRALLFGVLASVLIAYSFWVYTRVELRVAAGRWLAGVRALALVVVLLLLFNPRLPVGDGAGAPARWVLLDASLSMTATGVDGSSAWDQALERADALASDGWRVVGFGDNDLDDASFETVPSRMESRLSPALAAAAESGAREVRVLTDGRLEDGVAVRSALEALPVELSAEVFGEAASHAGIARFHVPDLSRADGTPVAELEVFGEDAGDSIYVEILEEGQPVAMVAAVAPSAGLRTATSVALPTPTAAGRVRYTARLVHDGQPSGGLDGFSADDEAVAFANVGFEEGGLVVVSLRPDWEPRYLMPVLGEVTGLGASGYLRAGPDRYLPMGRAAERGGVVDSATVRRAASGATLLVVHGLHENAEGWIQTVVSGPGRRIAFPGDPRAASLLGVEAEGPQAGEWYVSPDVPTSPIAGALAGAALDGLPPLSRLLVPTTPVVPPLQLQLRGAGAPESAFVLSARSEGRAAIVLASGFWRWAMRDDGSETYRRLWSGVAGWLLTDRGMAAAEPRPVRWVVARGEPIEWRMPVDTSRVRIRVELGDSVVRDTLVAGGAAVALEALPPSPYRYAVLTATGDTLGSGRFDVASTTLEMLPRRDTSVLQGAAGVATRGDAPAGSPLRTMPWPYLLVITLLCGEWIARRRSGLR